MTVNVAPKMSSVTDESSLNGGVRGGGVGRVEGCEKNSKQTEKALEVWLWMRHPATGRIWGQVR